MLGTKSKPATDRLSNGSSGSMPAAGETCIISMGTVIEGKFSTSENMRVDGFIKGEVRCDQRLVMGDNGKIEGTLFTKDAIVMGTVEGELTATGTLTLKGAALVKGTIRAKFLVVEEGARYVGECHIGE